MKVKKNAAPTIFSHWERTAGAAPLVILYFIYMVLPLYDIVLWIHQLLSRF